MFVVKYFLVISRGGLYGWDPIYYVNELNLLGVMNIIIPCKAKFFVVCSKKIIFF